MVNGVFFLHLKVETERRRLGEATAKFGLEDPRVLAQSRKLDKLIVELQRRKNPWIKSSF